MSSLIFKAIFVAKKKQEENKIFICKPTWIMSPKFSSTLCGLQGYEKRLN